MAVISQLITAFLGSLGFSMIFHVNKKYWLLIAVDAVISWGIFLGTERYVGDFFANILAAMFCSFYAHVMAKIVKSPTTCLLMTATVPMIPGGSLYYAIFYAFSSKFIEAKNYMIQTGKTIFAMAIGFAVVTWLFREIEKTRSDK